MNPIIEKIKKLLRMKRVGTAAEVETALRLAQELAAKHNIELRNINPDEEEKSRTVTERDALLSSRIPWECKYAALTCEEFFNISFLIVKGYRSLLKHRLTFIGTGWEIEIALHVYHFLVGHFRRQWRDHSGRCRNRQAFMYGMYHGLCQNLDARRKAANPGVDAVLCINQGLETRKAYIQVKWGETSSSSCDPDSKAQMANYLGWLAGKNTNINPAVKAGTPSRLQLT